MASVCFYFQVHQPFRLKSYSVFDEHPFYFDTPKNRAICEKVASKCYRPMNQVLLDLIRENKGNFRCSFSISGVALEQFELYTPDVLDQYKALAETGCVEFLAETTHHSLSFLYSRPEFEAQVAAHTALIEKHFGQTPTVFRNTELIYANEVGHAISKIKGKDGRPRFKGVCCEGWDHYLGFRKPSYVYTPPGAPLAANGRPLGLLLKNYRLSDDVAFRFSNRGWSEWPLTAEKFAHWVNNVNGDGYLVNLFMDYETFGEHQWADTGVFDFMRALPRAIFDVNPGQNHFITPSMALDEFAPVGEYDVPHYLSWADTERDLSAWLGNAMQANSLTELYKAEADVKRLAGDRTLTKEQQANAQYLLEDWRKLTTSDHFYYMCTKYWADGDVHKYFSPYDSPYDAYITFMNVLDNVLARIASYEAKEEATAI